MQFGHLAVVAAEYAEQVAREVVLIGVAETANNGAVYRNISGVRRVGGIYKNIAGVHVSVKKTVAKNLGEKDFYTAFSQQFQISSARLQFRHIGDWYAADALHDKNVAAGIVPVNLRHMQQFAVFKVATQLTGIRRFAAQIQFIEYDQLVICDHFHRTQASAVGKIPCHQFRQGEHQCEILANNGFDIGADNLCHNLFAAVQGSGMHLGHGRRRHGPGFETCEQLGHRLAQSVFDDIDGLLLRERRHIVL